MGSGYFLRVRSSSDSTGAGASASTSKSTPAKGSKLTTDSKPGGDLKKLKSKMKAKAKKTTKQKSKSSGKGSGSIGQLKGGKATSTSSGVAVAATRVLQNDLILLDIAKKLPARNLLPLRQISTLWNHTFLPQLALKHKSISLYMLTVSFDGYEISGWLISDYTDAAHIPIRSYKIHGLGMGLELDVRNFFQLCGNVITRLDLVAVELNSAAIESLRQIVFQWAPELHELSISSRDDEGLELEPSVELENQLEPMRKEISKLRKFTVFTEAFEYRPYFRLAEDVIQCAVGLEHLSLMEFWPNSYLRQAKLLSAVPTLSRLKGLKLCGLTSEHLRHLIQLSSRKENPLRLLELKISTVCSDADDGGPTQGATNAEMVDLINRFLSTQSSTLRILGIAVEDGEMEGLDDNARYAPQLPKMDNVQSLTLQCDDNWRSVVLPEEQTFASNFPGLKRLTFNFDIDLLTYNALGRVRPISQFSHEGVTSLKFEMVEMVESLAVQLSIFSQTWPFVSKLDIQLQTSEINRLLSSVWTSWPNLVSLRVEQRRDEMYGADPRGHKLDELLSGIPESCFTALRRRLQSIKSNMNMDSLRVIQTEFKTKPGISDLEQLQEFTLDTRDWTFSISDIGGYLGFAMMPSQAVQHIALIHRAKVWVNGDNGERQNCKSNRITADCRSFMRSVFGFNTVLDL